MNILKDEYCFAGGVFLAKIFVYNPGTNNVEVYYRGLLEPMPYVSGRTMTVGEFRANSASNILWTDKRMMETWNTFRAGWGKSIFIGYAFKRIWEGGHSAQSQHYAGLALDLGHTASYSEKQALYNYAVSSKLWSFVEPLSSTVRWVHVDERYGAPACASGGFPALRLGSKGVYVLILQDALIALGISGTGLDGIFGYGTRSAVMKYQTRRGLPVTGVVDCNTWVSVSNAANGIGRTSTVIV